MSEHIWLIEDDDALALPLVAALRSAGLDVVRTAGVAETVALSQTGTTPDLVLLDLGLPDGDGIDLARRLRIFAPSTVIVVLTARTEESDVIVALDAGADDYLTKPFHLEELLARVRALIRRAHGQAWSLLRCGELEIDTRSGRVLWQGQAVSLTSHEYKVLHYLLHHAGSVVSRTELTEHI